MAKNEAAEIAGGCLLALLAILGVIVFIGAIACLGGFITGGALWLVYNFGYLALVEGPKIPFLNFFLVGIGINLLAGFVRRARRVKVQKSDTGIDDLLNDIIKSR